METTSADDTSGAGAMGWILGGTGSLPGDMFATRWRHRKRPLLKNRNRHLLVMSHVPGIFFRWDFSDHVRHSVNNEESVAQAQHMRPVQLQTSTLRTPSDSSDGCVRNMILGSEGSLDVAVRILSEMPESLGSSEEVVRSTGLREECVASRRRSALSVGSPEEGVMNTDSGLENRAASAQSVGAAS